MRPTSTTSVLAIWERAYGLGPVERGLALLCLALPRESPGELSRLTIGRRDAALLDLRAALFGNEIQCLDVCPKCEEKIEVSFGVNDIRVSPSAADEPALDLDGRPITLRPVTTVDLLAIECEPAEARRGSLLRRCVDAPAPDSFSESELKLINDRLAELDPQADVRIALDCPRCKHSWSSRFDIVGYLWAEIDSWAQRLLAEVHSLAFAYGWPESDILNMSPWRRQLYLGMLRR